MNAKPTTPEPRHLVLVWTSKSAPPTAAKAAPASAPTSGWLLPAA